METSMTTHPDPPAWGDQPPVWSGQPLGWSGQPPAEWSEQPAGWSGLPPAWPVPSGPPVPAAPTIRWGCGDIGFGLALMLLATVVLLSPFLVGPVLSAISNPGADPAAIDPNDPALVTVGLLGTWIGLGGWPLIASRWRGLGSLREDFHYWIQWPKDVWFGLAGGAVAIGAGVLVALSESALGVEAISNADFISEARNNSIPWFIVLGLGAAVGAPLVEELFFRGLAYTAIERRLNRGWAVALSTVLFGILHFQVAPTAAAAGFLVLHITTFGLVLGLLRAKTDRVGASVIAHMTINGFGVIAAAFGWA